MALAYSYIRFSFPRQKLGDSIRRQVARSQAYCERYGLVLDENLRLSDLGVSAFRSRNSQVGALAYFLEAAESGRIPKGSVLIVESLDRLSRAAVDEALELFLRIIRTGVDIVTLEPERRHTKETIKDIVGLIEPLLIMSRANEESQMKSSRVSAVWDQRRKNAREKKTPFGRRLPWWVELKGGVLRPIPENAKVVQQIFDWKEAGHGVSIITKKLNAIPGIPLPKLAHHWSLSTVLATLRGRTVLGEYQPKRIVDGKKVLDGDPVEGFYPAIITTEQFYRVQESLKSKRRGRTVTFDAVNIFTGKLYNGFDGNTIYCYSNTQVIKGTKYVYYNLMSRGVADHIPNADRSRIKYATFEKAFLRYVRELKPSDFVKGKKPDLADEIAKVTGQIAESEHKNRTIRTRIKDKKPDEIGHYLDLLDEIELERKGLVATLEELKSQANNHDVDSVGEIRTLSELLENTEDEDAARDLRVQIRTRIDHLIDRITMFPSISKKRGRNYRVQFTAIVLVRFRDGSSRWFMTDHDANIFLNVKFTEEVKKLMADRVPK